ncbi:chitin deacetylase [Moniliophthora roreri MCA 2997]|uniref:Chitin deacetylase n=1 Tax=Moniliophthora roreri (strain MCA 2997) TaxID=1381753 RepID=V2X9Y0_MONRO|nr:chitin deacetylase [Moniliophthora roreri MCA 2997]
MFDSRFFLLIPAAVSTFIVQAASLSAPTDDLVSRASGTVVTKCVKPGTAALTFDDGPYKYLKQFVDTLDRHNAKGTFFLNGNNWDCIYDAEEVARVKYAFERGHQIACHTWAHEDLTTIQDRLKKEFTRTLDAIQKITGSRPAITRPPYGAYNNMTLSVAKELNQTLVNWDYDTGDAAGASVAASKEVYDTAAAQHHSTVLVLNHEPYEKTLHEVLPYAIEKLQTAGYQLVTVAECLGMDPYLTVGTANIRDKTWKC